MLLTRGGFFTILDNFMTQKVHFWARLRRNYCNNQLNYTDYCLVTYGSRTPICHPITITHDNYFNYSNYCLKTYWFSTHSCCFLRLRILLLQLYWLLQNNVSSFCSNCAAGAPKNRVLAITHYNHPDYPDYSSNCLDFIDCHVFRLDPRTS